MITFAPSGIGQRLFYTLATLILFVFFGFSITKSVSFRSHPTGADILHIIGPILPPNFDGNGNGREIDILNAALGAARGIETHPPRFHALPFGRHWAQFQRDDRYDAVMTVPLNIELGGYGSSTYISYENGVIYSKARFPQGLGNEPLVALHGKRITTFISASKILPQLGEHVENFALYAEREYQYSHSGMLLSGFVDAVIADRLVTNFYLQLVATRMGKIDVQPFGFIPIFCPTPYKIVFRDENLRRRFDEGLEIIRTNGVLNRINEKYETLDRASNSHFVIPASLPKQGLLNLNTKCTS